MIMYVYEDDSYIGYVHAFLRGWENFCIVIACKCHEPFYWLTVIACIQIANQ